jgi:hypothetical protein
LAQLYLLASDSKTRRRALETVRAAYRVEQITKGNPLYPKLRHVEAMALRVDGKNKRQEAAAMDREAWQMSLEKAPQEAILIGAEWADWAWTHDIQDEAAEGYLCAHRAHRRFILRQVESSEERLKVQAQTTYATRGAFALANSDLKEALKLLERASDLAFSAGADRRAMRLLRHAFPDIGERLDAAALEKNRWMQPRAGKWGLDEYGRLPEEARAAQKRLDSVVFEVRSLPGFANFALPSGWSDIVAAANETSLVYLAPTTKGTLAAVVRGDGKDDARIKHRLLPDGLREIHLASRPFIEAEFGKPRADSRAALEELLKFLGQRIMLPVREMLSDVDHGDRPFVVLPFGILMYMPLAAAILPASGDGSVSAHVAPGQVRFAYSSRALAQSRMIPDVGSLNAFVVNNPRPLPAQFNLLQLASFEVDTISRHFPTEVVAGLEARTERVLAGLANSGLIHFSCHGTVLSELEYSGVLLLSNFQVLAYQQVRLADNITARLVVLSACQSGIAGITIEHPQSLPAAFLAAGAKGVVGSLWHAEEMATLLLMIRFYELWPMQQSDPAIAVALAQEWLRSTTAEALRDVAPPAALELPAGRVLREAPSSSLPYAHPWFWAGFFVAGS